VHWVGVAVEEAMATIKKVTNKGKVSWKVDYRDPQGKRVQRRFPKKAQAEEFLAKVTVAAVEDRYDGLFARRPEVTFAELADHYAEACQFEKSYTSFKCFIIPVLRQAFGAKLLRQLTLMDIERFRNQRRAGITCRGRPRSGARVNRELSVLKHMLNKAVRWGFLEQSPIAKAEKLFLPEEGHRLRYLTEEEAEALLEACPGHLRPIVQFALNTGMRRGEIFGLKWEDVGPTGAYLGKTKAGRPRVVPLNETAQEVLKERRRQAHLKSLFVFSDEEGSPWKTLKESFAGACRRAGIRDFRFHDLRHTFASHLAMKGYSMGATSPSSWATPPWPW
jgi:integrase